MSDSGILCYVGYGYGRVAWSVSSFEERSWVCCCSVGPEPPCGAVWIQLQLHVKSNNVVQPPFTKATDKGTFFKMRNYMMNVNGNLRGPLSEALSACAGASRRIISRMMQRL